MRGLKHQLRPTAFYYLYVAPHTGAWIETLISPPLNKVDKVAPHTGAWIETNPAASPFMWAYVAPHTGAWIETSLTGMVKRG